MSITMGTTLASLVTNKRRVSALKSLGIVTVGDALTYYPFRVTEPVPLRAIREAAPGQQMAFAAVIRDMRVVPMNARRGYRLEATVDDADFARSRRVPGSTARLTFFSYRKSYVDWVSVRLRAGHVCGGLRYARRIHGSAAVHPSRNPHCRARAGRSRSGA